MNRIGLLTLNKVIVGLWVMVLLITHAVCANAQGKVVHVKFSPEVEDYAPLMLKALQEVYEAGGGTVEVAYGIYPLQTVVNFAAQTRKDAKVAVKGIKNAAGEAPVFFCDAEPGKTHKMFTFTGSVSPGTHLSVEVTGIKIVGNNVPVNRKTSNVPGDDGESPPWKIIPWSNQPDELHYGHPFMHHANSWGDAIVGINLKTIQVDDVEIREIYGNGIFLANYGDMDHQRMEAPSITNTKIINTWQWQDGFITGDGIILWAVNKARIENCTIYNDIAYTRWIGRSGIVVEHFSEGFQIKNNIIGGYGRNIHIENTYGGHEISNNKILASDFGVFLNEPEWDKPELMAKVKPVVVKENYFEYNMERITYKTFPFGGRRALVDTFLLSKKLNGLQIIDNEFIYNDGEAHPKNPQIYIGPVEEKDYARHGFTVKNNIFN